MNPTDPANQPAFTNRLEWLAQAIADHEGWYPGSHSYRTRNPGNMRLMGPEHPTDSRGFTIFPTLDQGWFALKMDLFSKCCGRTQTHLTPSSTLADLVHAWAPASDHNNDEAYLNALCLSLTQNLGVTVGPAATLAWFLVP